jgi:hypothetical protein
MFGAAAPRTQPPSSQRRPPPLSEQPPGQTSSQKGAKQSQLATPAQAAGSGAQPLLPPDCESTQTQPSPQPGAHDELSAQ